MQWLTAPARPERLALLRILVAGYGLVWLLVRAPHLRDVSRFTSGRWHPVGVLAWMDAPPAVATVLLVVGVAIASGLAVVLGWRHRWSGPTFALTMLLVTTWRTSWGQIFHTEHLLVLHLLVLAVTPAAAAWSLDARRVRRCRRAAGDEANGATAVSARFGWPIRVMALMTVATYVVAGVAKIRYGGASWLNGDVLAHQVAFDNVRKAAVGSPTSPVAGPLLDLRWVFTPLALTSLFVELGAPFALLSARAAKVWAGTAWLFHMGIVIVMVIVFAYPVSGVALAPVLLARGPGVPLPRVRQFLADRRSSSHLTGTTTADRSTLARP